MFPTAYTLETRARAASRMRFSRLSFAAAAVALGALGWLVPVEPAGVPRMDGVIVAVLAVAITVWLLRSVTQAAEIERSLGAYRLGKKIGEGEMGVVYKASHAHLPRPAANRARSTRRHRTQPGPASPPHRASVSLI